MVSLDRRLFPNHAQADALISAEFGRDINAEDTAKDEAIKQCRLITGHCAIYNCLAPNGETVRFRDFIYN